MENLPFGCIGGLFITRTAGELLVTDTNKTTSQHHDSVNVTDTSGEGNGESLLIKLPEATLKLAKSGNTLLPAVTRVFPIPPISSKKIMQVWYSDS